MKKLLLVDGSNLLFRLEGVEKLPFELEELEFCYNGVTTNEVLKGIGLK